MIKCCHLHIDVIPFCDVRYAFGHHEHFVKAMIINVYHNQLGKTHHHQ